MNNAKFSVLYTPGFLCADYVPDVRFRFSWEWGWRFSSGLWCNFALKMETVCFSETLVSSYESTQHYSPKEHSYLCIIYPFKVYYLLFCLSSHCFPRGFSPLLCMSTMGDWHESGHSPLSDAKIDSVWDITVMSPVCLYNVVFGILLTSPLYFICFSHCVIEMWCIIGFVTRFSKRSTMEEPRFFGMLEEPLYLPEYGKIFINCKGTVQILINIWSCHLVWYSCFNLYRS
jgi:hypothetical protein